MTPNNYTYLTILTTKIPFLTAKLCDVILTAICIKCEPQKILNHGLTIDRTQNGNYLPGNADAISTLHSKPEYE